MKIKEVLQITFINTNLNYIVHTLEPNNNNSITKRDRVFIPDHSIEIYKVCHDC